MLWRWRWGQRWLDSGAAVALMCAGLGVVKRLRCAGLHPCGPAASAGPRAAIRRMRHASMRASVGTLFRPAPAAHTCGPVTVGPACGIGDHTRPARAGGETRRAVAAEEEADGLL